MRSVPRLCVFRHFIVHDDDVDGAEDDNDDADDVDDGCLFYVVSFPGVVIAYLRLFHAAAYAM